MINAFPDFKLWIKYFNELLFLQYFEELLLTNTYFLALIVLVLVTLQKHKIVNKIIVFKLIKDIHRTFCLYPKHNMLFISDEITLSKV